ncbi:MAG: hypothetical protein AAF439_12325 [Pseudomonadota bacterium]
MRIVPVVFLLALAVLTSACATATRGTTETVTFVSDPLGTTMTTTSGMTCVTPCTLEIERSETFTAKFVLGEKSAEVFVDTVVADEVGATTAANILFTPIVAIPVALAVDAASGANLNHTPNPVFVSFTDKPLEAPQEGNEATLAASPAAAVEAGVEESPRKPFEGNIAGQRWGPKDDDPQRKPSSDAGEQTAASTPQAPREVPVYCRARPNSAQWRPECDPFAEASAAPGAAPTQLRDD